ncbi:hypothetical protein GBAR_LOCUS16822 [Geodia barretti]|uniref:Tiam1/2 second PH-like domain-containing protein n=1 Tax=Geodia barretti TaxID=519541 RepID=A0AA35SJ65_GEOBA|nr:hypothetical protein GBAR_LOCUS16822 [Geodia barretti]CAI8029644.1 hypothetical protein GBAR_LOCUS16822 [Geodia barretti]
MWLNPNEDLRAARTSWKKGHGPLATCFVFASAVVLVCVEKKPKRKSSSKSFEVEVGVEDTKFKILLPSVNCSVHDLPDSDGVTDMWQLKYRLSPLSSSSPSLISPLHTPSHHYLSYLLRSQSMEQKAAMVHLIRQSIGELRDTATTSGSSSPLPLHTSSPLAHPHNSHLSSYSPSHRHPLLPPSHSSPRHTRPRSNSQPHLQNLTPSPHPSPLAHSHHLPSLTDLTKHGYN